MNHYFTDNAEISHNRRVISFRFLGIDFQLNSDNGVFSKDSIDLGSQLLLKAVADQDIGNDVLDLGCGYGIIAIVLQKISNCKMTAIDINPRAIELTEMNSALNQVNINVIKNDGLDDFIGTYNTIVTNPPIRAGKETVYRFFDQSYNHLYKNGKLWVVIRKKQGAESAIKELIRLFDNCIVVLSKKGYLVLKSQKNVD